MEKNTNLPNADELALRYILNELDPSEVLMVEKAMHENQDLLIEIESMRATLRRLNQLPEMAPPPSLSQKVMQQAASFTPPSKTRIPVFSASGSSLFFKSFAAAIVICTVGLGSVYFFGASNVSNTPATLQQSAAPLEYRSMQTPLQRSVLPGNVASSTSLNGNAEPWVDQNNILHISVNRSGLGQVISSGLQPNTNMTRLTPVNRQPNSSPVLRDIQLTRSQQ
ncbi:MAG: hypothetical protein LAT67_09970 [Balneolales bacterium]|nr:hypothetical protein [Balneolales bacterium]